MSSLPSNYQQIINSLKEKIRRARFKASLAVNKELVATYWEIGCVILEQQKKEGWGAKVIDRLSSDLRAEFPEFKGLSVRNFKYMRAFAEAYPEFGMGQQPAAQMQTGHNNPSITIVQQLAAQLPWGHHQILLDKVKEPSQRLFYIQHCAENGWSRNILAEQIASNLYERQGNAITNFKDTLPDLQSDLAQQTLKNPYVFDFLGLGEEVKERELENALIQHLKSFMLELGKGFAYVGRQKNLVVEGDDFFLDLLFYNYLLRCFVVFELKVGEFKPEFAGKLNFYVNTINDQLKGKDDQPTVGVLLCKTPNETVVRFSLQGIESPIGVADYQLAQALPQQLKTEMPTVEELEAEIDKEYEELKNPTEKKWEELKQKL
ncbi:MAG: PDDEXK nuclease domain-containing protein, partial [Cyclobacteriaceae bacterium]